MGFFSNTSKSLILFYFSKDLVCFLKTIFPKKIFFSKKEKIGKNVFPKNTVNRLRKNNHSIICDVFAQIYDVKVYIYAPSSAVINLKCLYLQQYLFNFIQGNKIKFSKITPYMGKMRQDQHK